MVLVTSTSVIATAITYFEGERCCPIAAGGGIWSEEKIGDFFDVDDIASVDCCTVEGERACSSCWDGGDGDGLVTVLYGERIGEAEVCGGEAVRLDIEEGDGCVGTNGYVVAAGDGDDDVLGGGAAAGVSDGDGEGQLCSFTVCEEVDVRVGDVVAPADGTGTIGVIDDCRKREIVD